MFHIGGEELACVSLSPVLSILTCVRNSEEEQVFSLASSRRILELILPTLPVVSVLRIWKCHIVVCSRSSQGSLFCLLFRSQVNSLSEDKHLAHLCVQR
jgi:hypothetical protein